MQSEQVEDAAITKQERQCQTLQRLKQAPAQSCSIFSLFRPNRLWVTQKHRTQQPAKVAMPIIFNMVTLLSPHCPEGFQVPVVDFQQCLEGCWDHRRMLQHSCLTLHQLELSRTWDEERSLPSFALLCFISAPRSAKVEAHLPSLKFHAQQLFLFQLCWLLVHSQWPPGPAICGAQLTQLYANHQACPSW